MRSEKDTKRSVNTGNSVLSILLTCFRWPGVSTSVFTFQTSLVPEAAKKEVAICYFNSELFESVWHPIFPENSCSWF